MSNAWDMAFLKAIKSALIPLVLFGICGLRVGDSFSFSCSRMALQWNTHGLDT